MGTFQQFSAAAAVVGIVTASMVPSTSPAQTAGDAERVSKAQECSAIMKNAVEREIESLDGAGTIEDVTVWVKGLVERITTIMAWQAAALDSLAHHPNTLMVDAILEQCLEDPRLR